MVLLAHDHQRQPYLRPQLDNHINKYFQEAAWKLLEKQIDGMYNKRDICLSLNYAMYDSIYL